MALTNSQYDAVMRIYNDRQLRAQHLQEERRREISRKLPRIPEIDAEIASLSVRKAKALLDGGPDTDFDLQTAIQDLAEERSVLLLSNGYPKDYLERQYLCPLCKDTGYHDGKKCRCFRQIEIRMLYSQSNLQQAIRTENFDRYSLDFYSNEEDPVLGCSPRMAAESALRLAKSFTEHFQDNYENLCITGNVGTGKTFLTHCIAKELLEKGFSVLYLTAFALFELLGKYTFDNAQDLMEAHASVFDCDLLIIDDLGTEVTNTFVTSQLFLVINERDQQKKSTVISTNLSLRDFSNLYSERIASRIFGQYTLIQLSGEDIRRQKRT